MARSMRGKTNDFPRDAFAVRWSRSICASLFSAIRHVPNNQEVFMHAESDQSIIIEILERVDEVTEENAIK